MNNDPARGLARASDVLLDCADTLGSSDLTTQALVVALMANLDYATDAESVELGERKRLARVVVDLMSSEQLAAELSFNLMLMYVVDIAASERDAGRTHDQLALWADATQHGEYLEPINAFVRQAMIATPPDLSGLTSKSQAQLAALLARTSYSVRSMTNA